MSGYVNPDSIVSTAWLAERLNAPDVRVVDASWYMSAQKRNPKAEYQAEHIPGAVFFDIDDIADSANALPHMLPSAEKFSSRVRKLGLGDGSRIVLYDGSGQMIASARAWWMFRAMGHNDVAVLNGGLKKWKAEGRPVEDGEPPRRTVRCDFAIGSARVQSPARVNPRNLATEGTGGGQCAWRGACEMNRQVPREGFMAVIIIDIYGDSADDVQEQLGEREPKRDEKAEQARIDRLPVETVFARVIDKRAETTGHRPELRVLSLFRLEQVFLIDGRDRVSRRVRWVVDRQLRMRRLCG